MSERRQLGHWLTQTRQMKPTIVRRIKTLIIYAHPGKHGGAPLRPLRLEWPQLAPQKPRARPLLGDKLQLLLGALPQHLQSKRAALELA